MRPFRSRTIRLLALLGLVVLSLRPVPEFERVLDVLVLPARAMSELTAPFEWIGRAGKEVHAAATGSDAEAHLLAQDERRAHDELERAVLHSALPRTVPLPVGVTLVHAEVIDRRDLDTIRVRVESHTHLVRGLPVVAGDWFVGTVARVDRRRDHEELLVQLVTDAEARVGARIASDQEGLECELVVGGLAPHAGSVRLDVHNPSRRTSSAGEVFVHESDDLALDEADARVGLANGFRLGTLARDGDGEGAAAVLGVRPGLDYEAGLFQVLVLCPEDLVQRAKAVHVDPLDDPLWLGARLFATGEPSPWREGRSLGLGRGHGLAAGSALALGTRLFGRVARAGLFSADVSLLGDPGFSVSALAMLHLEGGPEPWVLGQLRGLGRGAKGELYFLWPATLPLDPQTFVAGSESVPATLWSGSGQVGVPRGLLIGTCALPLGPGPHLLAVREPEGETARSTDIRVRWVGQRGGEAP